MAFLPPPLQESMTRRRFLQAGLLGAGGLALYSSEVERHWIDVTRHEVVLANLPEAFDGLRIVQLSDIHMDEYTEPFYLRQVVRKVNSLLPDAVFLTGDYVSTGPKPHSFAIGAAWQCAEILAGLDCNQVCAVMGNHDVIVGIRQISSALAAHGVTVLNNACHALERDGKRIWIAGMIDPADCVPKPDLAIPASIRHLPEEPVILLCHSPDFADVLLARPAGQAVSLMFSGHTHGGQVHFPFVGPLTLPYLGRKYVHGWFRPQNLQLYVNRGIGTVGVPFRFNCPPEISAFTLRKG